MPEGAGAVEQAAAAQQQQKAAALARSIRERADGRLLSKIAFGSKKRGPTPLRTMSSPVGPKKQPFAALEKKQASAGETIRGAKKLFGPFRDAASLIKNRPKGMTAVMLGSAMVGGGITGGILLGHYKNRQRKLQEEERRRITKEKELTTDFASTPQTLKKKVPQLRG
jgi:hypothetical protein